MTQPAGDESGEGGASRIEKTRLGFGRLGIRIYLAGVAQIVLALTAFTLLRDALPHSPWRSGTTPVPKFIMAEMLREANRPEELRRTFERVDRQLGASVAFYTADGKLVASTGPHPPPYPDEKMRQHLETSDEPFHDHDHFTMYVNLKDQGGPVAYGSMRLPANTPRIPPNVIIAALSLLALGLTSWVLTGMLARPLQRLAQLARAFGSGDLEVRSNFKRRDELGQVANAFDEMAGRIARLVRAQKELLANVSHELRTPVSRIRVALDVANEGNERAAREMLTGIAEDLHELERLLDDVLTTARLDLAGGRAGEGSLPLRPERVPLTDLLDKAAARFRAAHPGHSLQEERDPQLPTLTVDATLFRRAIDNLLDNAGKYSPDGTRVTLRCRLGPQGVRVEIEDEGRGIGPTDLPQLFTPFFRADRSRTRATGGVGLGLTLARRIVDAHGGTLEVESALGKGTLARVQLPADAPSVTG